MRAIACFLEKKRKNMGSIFTKDIAVLDVNSRLVSAIVGAKRAQSVFGIKSVVEKQHQGYENGEWFDEQETVQIAKAVLLEAMKEADSRTKRLFIGVPAEFVTVVTKEVSVRLDRERRVIDDDISYLLKKGDDFVSVMGYDVERVTLGVSEEEDATLGVGESMRLLATYTPIDSIVNTTIWSSSDESVISVDQNGVVTALKEGRATISLLASVYSSEKKDELDFVEGTIDLTVEQKGASSIFGEKVVTSRTSLTYAELGVVKEEIASVEGGLLTEDGITVNADIAQITTKDGRRLTLTKCAQSDIAIRNTRFYSSESG